MATQKSVHNPRVAAETTPVQDIQTQTQALAYQLWLERGAPIGSPETDWHEAEERLDNKGKAKAAH